MIYKNSKDIKNRGDWLLKYSILHNINYRTIYAIWI